MKMYKKTMNIILRKEKTFIFFYNIIYNLYALNNLFKYYNIVNIYFNN